MKKGSFDLTGKAIDCSGLPALGDAGKEIFRALKVACGNKESPLSDYSELINANKSYLELSRASSLVVCTMMAMEPVVVQPSDVLGQASIDAAIKGGTIVFDGDKLPVRESLVLYLANGEKGAGYFFKKDKMPLGVIAYKSFEEKQPLSKESSMNTKNTKHPTAAEILKAAQKHMEDRAITYDKPQGERSMKATVEAFNAVTGHAITEEQGWHFMTILKIVRSQQGNYKLDNYEDGSAYFGLAGEAASKERN